MVKEVDKLALTETEAKVVQEELRKQVLQAWVRARVTGIAHKDLVAKYRTFMAHYNALYPGQFPLHVVEVPVPHPEI